jgi:hypothetical protein
VVCASRLQDVAVHRISTVHDSTREAESDQIFFVAMAPKFAARDIVDNSVKNARPVGVPGTKDELRIRISRQIRSIRTGRLRTLK